jgi:hypothetical protein
VIRLNCIFNLPFKLTNQCHRIKEEHCYEAVYFYFFIFVLLLFSCKENPTSPIENQQAPTDQYKTIRISSSGGVYQIGDGLSLIVPSGAVPTDTTVSVGNLVVSNLQQVFSQYPVDSCKVIAGFDILPHDLDLDQPITFAYTGLHITPGSIPIAHTVDVSGNYHSI